MLHTSVEMVKPGEEPARPRATFRPGPAPLPAQNVFHLSVAIGGAAAKTVNVCFMISDLLM
jgi:hypothetical protein